MFRERVCAARPHEAASVRPTHNDKVHRGTKSVERLAWRLEYGVWRRAEHLRAQPDIPEGRIWP